MLEMVTGDALLEIPGQDTFGTSNLFFITKPM